MYKTISVIFTKTAIIFYLSFYFEEKEIHIIVDYTLFTLKLFKYT